MYLRNAAGCFIVCDITTEKSLKSIKDWHQDLLTQLDDEEPETFPMIMLQNKVDLVGEEKKAWQTEEHLTPFKEELGMNDFFQVSAKENIGIADRNITDYK